MPCAQSRPTVFLNSHLLSEVEVTCDRVAFIKHGEVLETCDLNKLDAGGLSIVARVKDLPAEALLRLVYGRLDPAHTPPLRLDSPTVTLDDLRGVIPRCLTRSGRCPGKVRRQRMLWLYR